MKTILELRNSVWPDDSLERVTECPICRSASRSILHRNLVDDTFFTAPGTWTMLRCSECETAYLDPRPTSTSVGNAYASYYTHNTAAVSHGNGVKAAVKRILSFFSSSYVDWLKANSPSDISARRRLAAAMVRLVAPCREVIDAKFRHLHRSHSSDDRLLDIGCGGGDFLQRASDLGWRSEGIDVDPKAVAVAQSRGLSASVGSIDVYESVSEVFDVVTCNHVIEHVYDAFQLIQAMYRILKPGGRLWIETPNIESAGHAAFGRAWRGLEAPRHIFLLSARTLEKLLVEAGFSVTQRTPWNIQHIRQMFSSSEAIASGGDPHNTHTAVVPNIRLIKGIWTETIAWDVREFVCLQALKPG